MEVLALEKTSVFSIIAPEKCFIPNNYSDEHTEVINIQKKILLIGPALGEECHDHLLEDLLEDFPTNC